ncbi:hypothetical protein ACKUSY_08065 [Myroides odoratus]
MKTSKQTAQLLQLLSFGSVVTAIIFMLLSQVGKDGIYTYRAVGAIFELLWLPTIATLFSLPIAWFVLAYKKKVTWKQLLIPVVLLLGTVFYLIVFFT